MTEYFLYKITVFVHILRALEDYLNNTSASTLMAIFPYRLQFTVRKECRFAAIIEPLLPPRSIAAL